jgi:photosystem II stability/assembly factor-like uncharacterized protein
MATCKHISKTTFFLVFLLSIALGAVDNSTFFRGLKYRCIGPTRGGRVTAVAGVPSAPGTFFMGATGGGVWKTTDFGQSWINVSDGTFETGSIGAIAVSQANPDIIYVGTGSDGIRSNVITGRGIYKSVDCGKTWTFTGLRKAGQIGAVLIHPQNPDIVYIAAMGSAFGPTQERGIYRTRDGGKTWELVHFLSNRTGAVDLEFCPGDASTIYASMWHGERKPWTIISGGAEDGLYKSIDGGDSWHKLTGGLPSGLFGKSDLAVSAADSSRLYALIEAPGDKGGVYRSDDRGASFEQVSSARGLVRRPFYYTNIDADPTNADVVYVNCERFYKSTDGGKKWKSMRTPHGDNHDMWINPHDSSIFIQSNDGGANVTRDGGKTWSTQNNQPTAELYTVDVDDQFPYWVYAGQQDNSTIMVPSFPPYSTAIGHTAFWRAVGGSETGPAVPKPGNHNIVYANNKGRFGRYNKLTGQEKQYYVGAANIYSHNPRDLKYRFQRVAPIHVSPHDASVIYHCSQFVHKTTDEGVTWQTISPDLTAFEADKQVISGSPITRDITGEEFYSAIYSIQESTLQKGLIWVGANDGPVHVTRDGGKKWLKVTPRTLPPGGRVETVEPSPHRPGKAYIAVYRYLLNDWQPYIYRTDNFGKTWQRLTSGKNGIPQDSPTRVVREDPDRQGLLYAGTEFGMYISFDDGATWQPFQLNLPATPVTDIKVYRKDLVLSTMGRSFWILDNLTPLHQLSKNINGSDHHLFAPRNAHRIRSRRRWRRPAATDPQYPRHGLAIDYYLAREPIEEIQLDILDKNGTLVRGFSSKAPAKGQTPLAKQVFDTSPWHLEGQGTPRLPKKGGMHRFIWDMRHAGAWHPDPRRSGFMGPMALPGTYTMKMTIGKWSQSRTFKLLMDPRVIQDGVTTDDVRQQLNLCHKIRDTISRARMAAEMIKQNRKKLKGKKDNQAKDFDRQLAALQARFETARGTYQTPMLLDQLNYLYYMLIRADQKPGQDARTRLIELNHCLAEYIAKLKQIIRP